VCISRRQVCSLHHAALCNYCLSSGGCKSLRLPPHVLHVTQGEQHSSSQKYTACCVLMPKHTWEPVCLSQQSLTSSHGGLYHPGISHLVSCSHLLRVMHMEGKAALPRCESSELTADVFDLAPISSHYHLVTACLPHAVLHRYQPLSPPRISPQAVC